MNDNNCLQFDKGIMRLSAFDPLSNQYETRILTLPELPLLESLEHLFEVTAHVNTSSASNSRPTLRMTKSCSNKKSTLTRSNSSNISISNLPRRCQSNPNLSKKKQQTKQKNAGGPIRTKRSLSSAFNAVAGFIQKATNKKIRSQQWSKDTWVDELRFSTSSSSISSLSSITTTTTSTVYRHNFSSNNTTCENWWMSSPPISSY